MKLGVCAQSLPRTSLADALAAARALGFETLELPVDAKSPWLDLDAALAGGWRDIARVVRESGVALSALSNHQVIKAICIKFVCEIPNLFHLIFY